MPHPSSQQSNDLASVSTDGPPLAWWLDHLETFMAQALGTQHLAEALLSSQPQNHDLLQMKANDYKDFVARWQLLKDMALAYGTEPDV